MPERTLEQRYRLLAAAYLSGGASADLTQRLGAGLGQAVELITSALSRDLSAAPADLDREKVGALLGTILPARMSGAEEWRDFVPDVLDELLAFASEEESLTSAWELRTAVDENRGAFETALCDPKRPRLGGVAFAPDRRPAGKVGRNDPCPCGSGKKYKQCCLRLLG